MTKYAIKISKRAEKFILKQPRDRQEQLIRAIAALPNAGDIKHMAGGKSYAYRLRVGDYRVVYEQHDDVLLILVVHAGNRGDVYKK